MPGCSKLTPFVIVSSNSSGPILTKITRLRATSSVYGVMAPGDAANSAMKSTSSTSLQLVKSAISVWNEGGGEGKERRVLDSV